MKFLTIVIISIGLIVLFNAAGITTPSGGLTKQFLEGGLTTFSTTTFWTLLITVLTLAATGAVVAGLFGRAPSESYLIASLVSIFLGLVLIDMSSVYLKLLELADGWMDWVVTAIFIPLFIGLFVSVISYWRGSDG